MSSRNTSPCPSGSSSAQIRSFSRNSNDIKSSGFYPTSMSPNARMAIVEHMDSHYRRLQKVKAAVDTKPPKSYQLSRSPSPSRSCSSRHGSRSSLNSNDSQCTQMQRQEVIQSTNKINYYLEAMRREQQRLFSQLVSPNFSRPKTRNVVSATRLKHQDLIEKHSENFTNPERPFVPRVLKSNAKSKLRDNRWYNPPRRKEMKRSSSKDEIEKYEKDWERGSSSSVQSTSTQIGSVKGDDKCLSKWLDTQVYASENRRVIGSLNVKQEQTPRENGEILPRRDVNVPRSFNNADSSIKKFANDDSFPYLQFIVDVTNDILIRGIYTNKVLKQVFRSHLERRKNELKMDKMEAALKQLQIDLCIPDDCETETQSFGYNSKSPGSAIYPLSVQNVEPNGEVQLLSPTTKKTSADNSQSQDGADRDILTDVPRVNGVAGPTPRAEVSNSNSAVSSIRSNKFEEEMSRKGSESESDSEQLTSIEESEHDFNSKQLPKVENGLDTQYREFEDFY